MMQGFATVSMAGNLTGDPEVRYRPSGEAVASFCVAVNRVVKSEFQTHKVVDYLDCVQKGEEAEETARKIKKGDAVEIFGRLIQQRWEEKGYKKSKVLVDAVSITAMQTMATEGARG
jgi:single-strand DNA-binding protein